MTDFNIAAMPLPLDKPISEWDDLDHLIAETRAGEIAAALSPAPRRIRTSRPVYHWDTPKYLRFDGKPINAVFTEQYYH